MKNAAIVFMLVLVCVEMCWSCGGGNGLCTIFSGCSDTEYCYRRHCRPKGGKLGSCIYGFQSNTCLSGLSCTCNEKLCDAAAITGELGNGLGGLGIPDLGSAISTCCRCA